MAKDKRKYKGKKFLNWQCHGGQKETIDQFDTMKEARTNLREYQQAYGGHVWISQRPIDGWYKDGENA